MEKAGKLRLAADIGGTFTDVAAFEEASGRLILGKAFSTPEALVRGIEAGVKKACTSLAEAGLFLHGSTNAVHCILEPPGPHTAVLLPADYRRVPELARVNRP